MFSEQAEDGLLKAEIDFDNFSINFAHLMSDVFACYKYINLCTIKLSQKFSSV